MREGMLPICHVAVLVAGRVHIVAADLIDAGFIAVLMAPEAALY
jgi:hypothetical protein